MPQLNFDNLFQNKKITPAADRKCGNCLHLYKYDRWYKCRFKPRGFGYDLTLKHAPCGKWKLRPPDKEIKKYGKKP